MERVRDLVRNAIRHQVWLMFERIGAFIRELAGELEARTVIIAYERVGPAELSDVDRVWLRALHEACENSEVAFNGPHLCHRRGVRAVEPEEYLS